jgi:Zn-finger nucleic acid-binding protein
MRLGDQITLIEQIKLQVRIRLRLVRSNQITFDVRPSCCGAGLPNSQTVFRADTLRHGKVAMASVLTIWCTTRQCEVTTGIWIDAEALEHLARQTGSIRCIVCGQEHSIKTAYLKPATAHSDPVASTHSPHLQRRRPDAH